MSVHESEVRLYNRNNISSCVLIAIDYFVVQSDLRSVLYSSFLKLVLLYEQLSAIKSCCLLTERVSDDSQQTDGSIG